MEIRKKFTGIAFALCLMAIAGACLFILRTGQENQSSGMDAVWKITDADQPGYALRIYDDVGWESVQLPQNVLDGEKIPDVIWYRKWIYISDTISQYPMGLRLGRIGSMDEVYINGQQIGSCQEDEVDKLQRIRIYPIPERYIQMNALNLLAVRVQTGHGDFAGIYAETPKIGPYKELFFSMIQEEGSKLVFSSIFFLIGSSFLWFFVQRKKEMELLFFGIGCVAMGIYTFFSSQWRFLFGWGTSSAIYLYLAVIFTLVPAYARFSYLHLEKRSPGAGKLTLFFDYASRMMVGSTLCIYTGLLLYPDKAFWYFFYDTVSLCLGPLFSIIAIGHAWSKFPSVSGEDRIEIILFTIAFLSGIAEAMVTSMDLQLNFVMWGVMLLVIFCTGLIIRRFFYLQDKVQEYSSGLERLVEERTGQLRRMEASRRRLLANIAHDLRTPVSSVLGHAELLLENILDSPEEQKNCIRRIHSKMLGFNRLIQDLFELAGLEAQPERFQMQMVPVKEFMEEIYQKYLFDVENAGIRFINESKIETDARILADAERLDQVFANLISNAVRYVGENGEIRLQCWHSEEEQNNVWKTVICFSVVDNGRGISPEFVDGIFERFNRGVESGTSPAEHSGLGLAISKEIVTAHQGRIFVDPMQAGCAICFVLPASNEI